MAPVPPLAIARSAPAVGAVGHCRCGFDRECAEAEGSSCSACGGRSGAAVRQGKSGAAPVGVVDAVGGGQRAQAETGPGIPAASEAPVPPSATARSVALQLELLIVLSVASVPSPRLVLSSRASLAPVPPLTTARSVPTQSSLLMVPPPPPPVTICSHRHHTAGVVGDRHQLRRAGAARP